MKWGYYNETSDELDHFGFFLVTKLNFILLIIFLPSKLIYIILYYYYILLKLFF
jgi:hypothetical protein